MRQTGAVLQLKYKKKSLGVLAANVTVADLILMK